MAPQASTEKESSLRTSKESSATTAIENWLISKLSTRTGMNPNEIDVHQPFASYGLNSIQLVELAVDLEIWLGRPLSPTLAVEYPTIKALAKYLASESIPSPE